ncbi:MAG: glycosyltransferase family 1 protein [Patescibacteria group bacterium]|nr:glycosyltransferase family 1 protein [Patescibacteria group bacterium]
MRIGIDAQTILNPKKGDLTGIGHYTYQLIKYLLEIDQKNEYVLFFNYRVRSKDIKKFEKENVKICRFPFSQYKKYLPFAYSEMLSSAYFLKEKLDVLHVPGGRAPITYKKKLTVSSYKLGIEKYPEMYSKKEVIKYKTKPPAYKRADVVIAPTESAKSELINSFKIESEKIRVINNAFDKKFFQDASVTQIQKAKEKYGIDGEYILFMNTIKPLNNLSRLIEAFLKLRLILKGKKQNSNYKLVIAGKSGWMSDKIMQIAKDFGLKNEVIFPGYIEPDDLNAVFSGADIFVSVPIYEEFGATVLEAFACGIPVVCSNVPSLKEIAGDVAIMVDPYDIDGIKCSILKVLDDNSLRESLKKRGLEVAKKYHWKKTAEETLKVFEEVVG